ncbi:hypothetical protein K2173_006368 [Erythroxylum novogranatense]|uniref:AMP deaminase n=1 Tax=Erythroxylum novogranatense TaxID=1862640 RepID=A0AAV8U785_9ROSI|nr:hypothetical protein K2173_006368 [Erythroxylum novogranatense]
MESSSSSSTLHLALAALVGASLMAVSAFYIHRRSVDQVLDRLIQLRRKPRIRRSIPFEEESFEEEEEEVENDDGQYASDGEVTSSVWSHQTLSRSLDDRFGHRSYRMSCSLPNAVSSNHWFDEGVKSQGEKLNFIPAGLPPLQMNPGDGEDKAYSSSVAILGRRIMTPRSPGNKTLESALDSDEEGTEIAHDEDEDEIMFSYGNDPDSKFQATSVLPFRGDDVSSHQDQEVIVKDGKITEVMSEEGNKKIDAAPLHQLESMNSEEEEVLKLLRECLELRNSYIYRETVTPWTKVDSTKFGASRVSTDPLKFEPVPATSHHFRMEDGVIHVYADEHDTSDLFPVVNATTFFTDMHHLLRITSIGNVRSTCYHRLRFLEEKFRLHLLVNADREFLAQKGAPHRDFYNIRKVDTHVHHSACMNQKHLLRFIKSKLRKESDEVVIFRDGKYLTLNEVFESLDLTGHDLNVDLLDVHADKSTFHRFDKFNLKYNPCGQSRLREIFLKQDNLIQGRFLAEVTKEVLSDLKASKYQMAEYRISVYGRKQSEWDQLASWFINNEIYSDNALWLIQLPRLYNVYKQMGTVKSFQNIIENIFIPLFEVTVNPNSHPQLHVFLMHVVGFDIVDDESKPERRPTKHMPTPAEWTNEFNPAYSYYTYYCYANLYTLNKLRESKGFPTIKLRPHCGEAGDIDHLAAGFLLCNNISHGINLRKSPVLQYLFYLSQIGLAMSPLSNNSLFLDYHRNPFHTFFQRGLNVSLSSDDPLQIHLTKEALVEEYSVAAKVWKLSSCDLCEIARNSVYQSGFSHEAKLHWLGSKYFLRGPKGNDIQKTNVPNLRISFRHEAWKEEMQYVYSGKARIPEEVEY